MAHKFKALLWWTLALALALSLATAEDQARARGKREAAAAGAGGMDLEQQRASLASSDVLVAQAAADRLGTVGPKQAEAARGLLLDALSVGLAPDVAIAALDALASLGKAPASLGMVRAYLSHRRADVRSTALATLAALDLPNAEAEIVATLSDRDLDVRKVAAELVAQHQLKSGYPRLVALLGRGEEAVIDSLGKLASPELAQAVADLAEKVPDRLVARALGAMLLNPKFGPDDVRLDVVQVLGGLPGDDAVKALDAYVASVPAKDKRESRTEAIEAAEKRRNGGGR